MESGIIVLGNVSQKECTRVRSRIRCKGGAKYFRANDYFDLLFGDEEPVFTLLRLIAPKAVIQAYIEGDTETVDLFLDQFDGIEGLLADSQFVRTLLLHRLGFEPKRVRAVVGDEEVLPEVQSVHGLLSSVNIQVAPFVVERFDYCTDVVLLNYCAHLV